MPQPYVHRYVRHKPEDYHSVGQLVEVIIGYLEHGARIEELRDGADQSIVRAFREEAIRIRKLSELYETKAPGFSQHRGEEAIEKLRKILVDIQTEILQPIENLANAIFDNVTRKHSRLVLMSGEMNGRLTTVGALDDYVLDPLQRAMRYAAGQVFAAIVDEDYPDPPDRCCLGSYLQGPYDKENPWKLDRTDDVGGWGDRREGKIFQCWFCNGILLWRDLHQKPSERPQNTKYNWISHVNGENRVNDIYAIQHHMPPTNDIADARFKCRGCSTGDPNAERHETGDGLFFRNLPAFEAHLQGYQSGGDGCCVIL